MVSWVSKGQNPSGLCPLKRRPTFLFACCLLPNSYSPIPSDSLTPKVLALVAARQSYRQIGRQLDLSKNTVLEIVKREREKLAQIVGCG